jgi:hypothetical protein
VILNAPTAQPSFAAGIMISFAFTMDMVSPYVFFQVSINTTKEERRKKTHFFSSFFFHQSLITAH